MIDHPIASSSSRPPAYNPVRPPDYEPAQSSGFARSAQAAPLSQSSNRPNPIPKVIIDDVTRWVNTKIVPCSNNNTPFQASGRQYSGYYMESGGPGSEWTFPVNTFRDMRPEILPKITVEKDVVKFTSHPTHRFHGDDSMVINIPKRCDVKFIKPDILIENLNGEVTINHRDIYVKISDATNVVLDINKYGKIDLIDCKNVNAKINQSDFYATKCMNINLIAENINHFKILGVQKLELDLSNSYGRAEIKGYLKAKLTDSVLWTKGTIDFADLSAKGNSKVKLSSLEKVAYHAECEKPAKVKVHRGKPKW